MSDVGVVCRTEVVSIAIDVWKFGVFEQIQIPQNHVFTFLFALEGREIASKMSYVSTIQIETAPKEEIVVDEAVTHPLAPNDSFKRDLKRRKKPLEEINQVVACVTPVADNAAEVPPYGQKLFLHKSVSRIKPGLPILAKWMSKLYKAETMVLPTTLCEICFIQPNTKRPGRTFYNDTKPKGCGNHNDGLSYAAIVLLHEERNPINEHDEASHLCGHSRCFNASHLVWEPMGINASRNECHHYNVQCNHVPKCIVNTVSDYNLVQFELAKRKKIKKALTKYFFLLERVLDTRLS